MTRWRRSRSPGITCHGHMESRLTGTMVCGLMAGGLILHATRLHGAPGRWPLDLQITIGVLVLIGLVFLALGQGNDSPFAHELRPGGQDRQHRDEVGGGPAPPAPGKGGQPPATAPDDDTSCDTG